MTLILTGGPPKRQAPARISMGRPDPAARERLTRGVDRLISAMVMDLEGLLASNRSALLASPARLVDQIREQQFRWREIFAAESAALTEMWARDVNDSNRARLRDGIARALGIDTVALIDAAGLSPILEAAGADAALRITDIPDEIAKKISEAVLQNFQGTIPDGQSLSERIRDIAGMSQHRAKFIARDQTATLNGALNQARMIDAGIPSYEWRSSRDMRTVGAPGGLYKPTPQHGNHWARNGKIYRWDQPPADGHPGAAIGCRCTAAAVLDPAILKYV